MVAGYQASLHKTVKFESHLFLVGKVQIKIKIKTLTLKHTRKIVRSLPQKLYSLEQERNHLHD